MSKTAVYHDGELAVQTLAGARETAERHAQLVGTEILGGALGFFAKQPLLAAAAVDDEGAVWCSAWCGEPGFAASPDPTRVVITRALDRTPADDPVRRCVHVGAELGLLAIELGTRRRLRVNGVVARASEAEIEIAVRESFPNCPKYITKRRLVARPSSEHGEVSRAAFVARVDTMFVGSVHPERGLDASHRGGEPGFVRMIDEHTLRVPDYPGNGMFQTLGNLHVDPRAGVVLLDLERGRALAATGVAKIVHGREDPDHPTGGTGRYWELVVHAWREQTLPSACRWELVERSPFNPQAG